MKIRLGFVSNSSSSSYTCSVCGGTQSGMDVSLGEAEMYQCSNGHIFCEDHVNKIPLSLKRECVKESGYKKDAKCAEEMSDDEFKEWLDGEGCDYLDEMRYEMPPEICPCCTFNELDDKDLIQYMLVIHSTSRSSIGSEMRERFKSYDEFKEWLSERKK